MNINISQPTSFIETVTKNLISKLYDIAINAKEEDTISYRGNLYSATGYADEINYLQNKFSNLIINVPESRQYIKFESDTTENVLANKIGDGEGVPVSTKNSLTSLPKQLFQIDRFEELEFFTNVNAISVGVFGGRDLNKMLTSIDLKNITVIGDVNQSGNYNDGCFMNCNKLLYLGDTSNITHIGTYCFAQCSSLDPSKWYVFDSIQEVGYNINSGCSMRKIVFGDKLNKMLYNSFNDTINVTVVILSKVPPTLRGSLLTGGTLWNFLHKVKFYVPDEAWLDYTQDENWGKLVSSDYIGTMPSNLFKISELSDEYKNELQDIGINITEP